MLNFLGSSVFSDSLELSLAELRCSTSCLETVLFTLFHTWITCKESSSFQNWSVLSVCLKQCSCNAVSDSTSLSCVSAAFYINENIKFALCLCSSQWLTNDNFQCFKTEILVDISFIDCDFACTRCKVNFFLLPVP